MRAMADNIQSFADTSQGYRGGVRRLASRLWRNSNLRASVILFCILFPLLLADRPLIIDDWRPVDLKAWIAMVGESAVWALLGLIPLWTMGRFSHLLYAVVLPLELVLVCVEWFVRVNFNMILTGAWVGMLFASSPEELKIFGDQYFGFTFCFCLAAIVTLIVLTEKCMLCVRKASVSRWTLVSVLCAFVALMAIKCWLKMPFAKIVEFFPTTCLVPDSVRTYREQCLWVRMLKNPQLPATVRVEQESRMPVTGVFVLGESMTRTHMSLYGYERATTPNEDALRNELVVFGDMVTTDGNTSAAMRGLFSTRTTEHHSDFRYSMSQILKRCGFSVALYSNHRRWDQHYSDETFSFAGCDPFLCMSEQGETNHYDGVLLKYLDRSLECATCNRVVFLHLLGSHFPLPDRYPSDGAPFGTRTENGVERTPVDHYDNTIWYTDKILGEVVRKLKALHKPTWMIYVSDHGETPSAKGWRTATDNDLWEIPFVVWTSPEFHAAYPERVAALRRAKDKPLQSDQLLYGLLRFMGVEGLGNAPEEDFLSDSFKPRTPRLILGGGAIYDPNVPRRD